MEFAEVAATATVAVGAPATFAAHGAALAPIATSTLASTLAAALTSHADAALALAAAVGLRSCGRHQLQPVGGGLRPNGLLKHKDGLHGQSVSVLQPGGRPGRRLLLRAVRPGLCGLCGRVWAAAAAATTVATATVAVATAPVAMLPRPVASASALSLFTRSVTSTSVPATALVAALAAAADGSFTGLATGDAQRWAATAFATSARAAPTPLASISVSAAK